MSGIQNNWLRLTNPQKVEVLLGLSSLLLPGWS